MKPNFAWWMFLGLAVIGFGGGSLVSLFLTGDDRVAAQQAGVAIGVGLGLTIWALVTDRVERHAARERSGQSGSATSTTDPSSSVA